MLEIDSSSSSVCVKCIDDEFLTNDANVTKDIGICSYCDNKRQVMQLANVADKVNGVIENYYRKSQVQSENIHNVLMLRAIRSEGPSKCLAEIICQIAGIERSIAMDIIAYLSTLPNNRDTELETGQNPYDAKLRYVPLKPIDRHFSPRWQQFRDELRYRNRFFAGSTVPVLRDIFEVLRKFDKKYVQKSMKRIEILDQERFAWRARKVNSTRDVKKILKSLTSEMGPPPTSKFVAGRMNAPGISMFYGAMDADTAVAEVRPPVGSFVVVAKFAFLNQVKLLDIDELGKIHEDSSPFDPDYSKFRSISAFFGRLAHEVSVPVVPDDEASQYLPTQALADYLAHECEPRFDGVVFGSAQTGGTGRNVVIFNHACRIASDDQRVFGGELYIIPEDINDYTDNRWKIYWKPSESQKIGDEVISQTEQNNGDATLQLDVQNIEIRQVIGVSFCTYPLSVVKI